MRTGLAAFGVAIVTATSVLAAAPAPKKPIQFERMTGRWYEVARTANDRQKDCHGAYADWVKAGEKFTVTNHCRKGSATGPDNVFKATARLVDAARARISMAFFLGAVNQEYWILDHADDYSWSIMATPGGNYVWVFSRQKTLPASQRDALIARVKAFGYPVSKLEIGK
jgi:apolipoprotein D and lipocalin family protein